MDDHNRKRLNLGSAGMRGIVGAGLHPGNAGDFASAYGTLNPGKTILVGTDPRGSSPMLKSAVLAGLLGCGCECVDGGIMTAGLMHFLIPHRKFDGGILISGGHQNAGWNALIALDGSGAYFEDFRLRELFDCYHGGRFNQQPAAMVKPLRVLAPDAAEDYWDFLRGHLNVELIASAHLRVVADFCNGSGAAYFPRFSELLGLDLIGVNDTPSSILPHDPEPRPRTESLIRSVIRPLHADAGLVFNSECSRLGIVSDEGEPLSEELTFPLVADYYLEHRAPLGSGVVVNVCSSRSLDDVVRRRRGILHKCKVGQARVIDAMRSTNSVLGGEGSGSFTDGSLHGFDGFLMAGLLLESIAVRKMSLGKQLLELPRYHMIKQTIPCDSPNAYRKLRALRQEFELDAEVSETDGLRFDWDDGFLSLRLAGTDSLLRLISESTSREAAEERAWRVRLLWERND